MILNLTVKTETRSRKESSLPGLVFYIPDIGRWNYQNGHALKQM